MRFRLPLGRWLLLFVVFLLAMVAMVPLRIALDQLGFDERGLGARAVTGTLWSGELTEARLRSIKLGDLEAGLALLPLLAGEARMALENEAWRATLIQTANTAGVVDLSGRLGPEAIAATFPVAAIEFDAVNVRFRDGLCAEATGTLRLEPRATSPALATLGQLSGTLRCEGEALMAPMVSGSGRERVDLRLFGDGRYRLTLIVQAGDPATSAALTAAGFVTTAEGMTRTSEGSF